MPIKQLWQTSSLEQAIEAEMFCDLLKGSSQSDKNTVSMLARRSRHCPNALDFSHFYLFLFLKKRQALCVASKYGYVRVMEKLINHGADVDPAGVAEMPLYLACMHGKYDAALLLLQHGANPYKGDQVHLYFIGVMKFFRHVR